MRHSLVQAMRAVARLLCMSACCSLPQLVSAQGSGGPLEPVCPAGKTPRIDTTQVIVGLDAAKEFRDSAYTAAERQAMAFYAEGIARHFVAPATLGDIPLLVDQPASLRDGADNGGRAVLTGRLVLILRKDGRLRTSAWEQLPLAFPLADAIVRATQVADSAGEFDGIMRPEETTHGDTLAIEVYSRLPGTPPPFPLMRAGIVGYRGESLAMMVKRANLEYPREAARLRVGGEGEVRFVVGSDGRAVDSMIQVTRATWRDFVIPMRKAIANSLYEPATSGGCKVPTLARQQFGFTSSR